MSERIVIQSADYYSIPDEKTGVVNEIYQVFYFNQYRDAAANAVGSKPIKVNCSKEIFESIVKSGAPAVYDVDYGTRPGAGGKPALYVTGAKHVKNIDMGLLLGLPVAKAA